MQEIKHKENFGDISHEMDGGNMIVLRCYNSVLTGSFFLNSFIRRTIPEMGI